MLFFRSERGIGRGETPETQIDAPLFAVFMLVSAVALLLVHLIFHRWEITMALAVSVLVFGGTVLRVSFGVYVLAIAMLLSPEVGQGTVGTMAERDLNLRYDDILIVVIFFGVLVKMAYEGRATSWLPSRINTGIVAYYGVCIISTLLALRLSVPAWDRSIALFVMIKMLQFYMVFFLVANAIQTPREIRGQLTVFFIVAAIVCLYGIFTIGTLERIGSPLEKGKAEPNTLGGYLTIVICTALGLMIHAPTRKLKLLFLGLALLAIFPFLHTLSRASYLAVLAGVLALGFMSRRMWIVLAVVAVLVLSPYVMPEEVIERVNYTFQRTSGAPVYVMGKDTGWQVDKSTHERIYVWEKVRFNLRVWPWFGGGVSWETVLDSQYARVLIETGLFGFATFVFLQLTVLRTMRETYHWALEWVTKGLALGAFSFTIALIIHSMGTISFLIVRIMGPFWYLVALTVVARHITIQQHHQLRATWQRQAADLTAEPNPPATGVPQPAVSRLT